MAEQLSLRGTLKGHNGWVTQIATTPMFPEMILSSKPRLVGARASPRQECLLVQTALHQINYNYFMWHFKYSGRLTKVLDHN